MSSSVWVEDFLTHHATRYLSSESDINLLIRGVRLILKIAYSEPLKSQLEFHYGNTDKKDYFWLCDQEENKVGSYLRYFRYYRLTFKHNPLAYGCGDSRLHLAKRIPLIPSCESKRKL